MKTQYREAQCAGNTSGRIKTQTKRHATDLQASLFAVDAHTKKEKMLKENGYCVLQRLLCAWRLTMRWWQITPGRKMCLLTAILVAVSLIVLVITLELLCDDRAAIMMMCEKFSSIKNWRRISLLRRMPFRVFFDGNVSFIVMRVPRLHCATVEASY